MFASIKYPRVAFRIKWIVAGVQSFNKGILYRLKSQTTLPIQGVSGPGGKANVKDFDK